MTREEEIEAIRYYFKSSTAHSTAAAGSSPTVTERRGEGEDEAEMEKDTSDGHFEAHPEECCGGDDNDGGEDDSSSDTTSSSDDEVSSFISATSTPSSAPTSPTIDAQRPEAPVAQIDLTNHPLLQLIHSRLIAFERRIDDHESSLAEMDRQLAEIRQEVAEMDRQLARIRQEKTEMDRRLVKIERRDPEIERQNAVVERQHRWAQTGDCEPGGRDRRTSTDNHRPRVCLLNPISGKNVSVSMGSNGRT
ncbi:hypothetical protein EDD36DRAFT_214958 [Exophiala viscosa]|uniref:Uncharacterized protein n=1 Tax=Exophiala viscosa TaxID=2486360 RepID=A0AAN6E013_9EURO|nr:hypothetical protein EDD36DRAFT_214958 [Exophiala viscosa]